MNKYLIVLITIVAVLPNHSFSATEKNLKIVKVGTWAQGSPTFYFEVDRKVGPPECFRSLIKVDLYSESDSYAELMSKNMVRSMVLTAMVSGSSVDLILKDLCLYNSPTINQIWISN